MRPVWLGLGVVALALAAFLLFQTYRGFQACEAPGCIHDTPTSCTSIILCPAEELIAGLIALGVGVVGVSIGVLTQSKDQVLAEVLATE